MVNRRPNVIGLVILSALYWGHFIIGLEPIYILILEMSK